MSNSENRGPDWLTVLLLVLTIIYPGWFYSNGAYANLFYLPILSLLLITSSLFAPILSTKPDWSQTQKRCIAILKDPVIGVFFLFLFYVFIQFLNSGAVRVFQNGELTLKPFLYQHLPFSFNQVSARKALVSAFACFAILLSIRHGLSEKKSFFYFILAILVNAVLLAILG